MVGIMLGPVHERAHNHIHGQVDVLDVDNVLGRVGSVDRGDHRCHQLVPLLLGVDVVIRQECSVFALGHFASHGIYKSKMFRKNLTTMTLLMRYLSKFLVSFWSCSVFPFVGVGDDERVPRVVVDLDLVLSGLPS